MQSSIFPSRENRGEIKTEVAAVDNARNRRYTSSRSCGCSTSDCDVLLGKIRAVDFAIQETVLYLDAYPCCREALEYYHQLVEIRENLNMAYTEKCGPLTKETNKSTCNWEWIASPWPWEPDANR